MSYAGIGTVEIDLTGRRYDPYYRPPPTYIRTTPPTAEESRNALIIGVAMIGLFGLLIWKAPRGSWTTYRREPDVRIRVNRKRRRKRRRRTSRKRR